MDQKEIGRAPFANDAGAGLAEQFAAMPGRCRQRLPGFQPRLDKRLDLPSQVIGASGPTAEIGSRSDQNACFVSNTHTLLGVFEPLPVGSLDLGTMEPFQPG